MSCNTDNVSKMEREHRSEANRALAVSAIGLGLTGGIELLLAMLTGSVALLGDALHNLSDVSTSALVFLGFKLSERPPSRKYPYGLERAEDLAGLGVALVIWASAVFAGYESYRKLIEEAPTMQVWAGMGGLYWASSAIESSLVTRKKSANASGRSRLLPTPSTRGSMRFPHSVPL